MKASDYKEVKGQYRKLLEFGMIVSLLFCVLLFQGSKRLNITSRVREPGLGRQIEQTDVVLTKQELKKAEVKMPKIPVPGEDTDIVGDDVLPGWLSGDLAEVQDPPEPPVDPGDVVFFPVEHPAEPVGGFGEILKHLKYPEMARLVGIEGRVVIFARIDEQGNVIRTLVHQSVGFESCDINAVNAVKAVKWKPAKQRDVPIAVWVSIPIDFRLR
jgi:protein TonB